MPVRPHHLLVLGGVGFVALSFLLGWLLSAHRMKGPIEPQRWLLTAHTVALQEGFLCLGLAYAIQFARLPLAWATAGAWLLIVGGGFQVLSPILNQARGVDDQFKRRSAGWMAATVNAVLNTTGVIIVVVGVARGLKG